MIAHEFLRPSAERGGLFCFIVVGRKGT
jgi:hypothetical protein